MCNYLTILEMCNLVWVFPETVIMSFITLKIQSWGLQRCLSGEEHWLLWQGTEVWFPELKWQLITICNSSARGSNDPF